MSSFSSQVDAVTRSLDKLGRVRSSLAPTVARVVDEQIKLGFSEQRDPYGKKWAAHRPATTRIWGAHKLLVLSGKGLASIKVSPKRGAGIKITLDSKGLAISQVGRGKAQAKRMILPNGPLPKLWRVALEKEIGKKIKEILGGSR